MIGASFQESRTHLRSIIILPFAVGWYRLKIHLLFDIGKIVIERFRMISLAIPFLLMSGLGILIWRYYTNIPFWDEWAVLLTVEKLVTPGVSKISALLEPQNEHVIPFPKAIMVGLFYLTRWTIGWNLVLSFVMAVVLFFVIYLMVKPLILQLKDSNVIFLTSIFALLVFSFSQWENWLWGWQIAVFMNILCIVMGFYLICNYELTAFISSICIFLGIIAQYSFGNGVLYWPIGIFAIWFRKKNPILIYVWVFVTILTITIYRYQLIPNPDHSFLSDVLNEPINYLIYFLAFLGSPIANYGTVVSILVGLIGLLIFCLNSWAYLKMNRMFLPLILLGFYAVGTALLIGIGRVSFGPSQALSSRYITFSNLLWLCDFVFLIVLLEKNSLVGLNKLALYLGLLLLISSAIVTYYHGIEVSHVYHNRMETAKEHISKNYPRTMNDEILSFLHPQPYRVRAWLDILNKYHLNLFKTNLL